MVAIAKFAEEVHELDGLGVPSLNIYAEAGPGLTRHALQAMGKKRSDVGMLNDCHSLVGP